MTWNFSQVNKHESDKQRNSFKFSTDVRSARYLEPECLTNLTRPPPPTPPPAIATVVDLARRLVLNSLALMPLLYL